VLVYTFDPTQNGWNLTNNTSEISSIVPNLEGMWSYSKNNDYTNLNITYADASKIIYDLEYCALDTSILSIGTNYLTTNQSNSERTWVYEYDAEKQCVVFTTNEPVFTITYGGAGYEFPEALSYKAYFEERNGTSGFYLTNDLLTQNST